MSLEAAAFVATPGDVPLDLVPEWVETLFVQVAWGAGPPPQPITDEWLRLAGERFHIHAWAWCNGGDVEAEAAYHAHAAARYGCSFLVANMEEAYDAHGNAGDWRYRAPTRYLDAFEAAVVSGRLEVELVGITSTWSFGSDCSALIADGLVTMPQAFSVEVLGATITAAVEHAKSWGWPLEQIRPLLQAYPTNGSRPDAVDLNAEAAANNVGGIAYTVEQAMDPAGQEWLNAIRPTLERPQPSSPAPNPGPQPEPAPAGTLIGSQHGITAAMNRLRQLDPGGTKPNRTSDLATWGAWDKLERTLLILAADHDAEL